METPEQMVARMAAERTATKATPEKRTSKERFLDTFANDGTVSGSAKAAGVNRCTVYKWLDSDPEFAQAFADAKEAGIESLEKEARRRAMNRSDTLLIFLLKAARPDIYADRVKQEVTGANGGPIAHADQSTEADLDAELERITAALEAAEARPAASETAEERPPR